MVVLFHEVQYYHFFLNNSYFCTDIVIYNFIYAYYFFQIVFSV